MSVSAAAPVEENRVALRVLQASLVRDRMLPKLPLKRSRSEPITGYETDRFCNPEAAQAMKQPRPRLTVLRYGRYGLMAAVLLWTSLTARSETFSGPIAEAEWHVDATVFECNLLHPIPHFGTAVFSHRSGEEQRFYLRQNNQHLPPGEAQLSAQHPVWRESRQRRLLDTVALTDDAEVIQLDFDRSQALIAELRGGRQLVITRSAWRGQGPPAEVVLEPVGFRPALASYQDCLSGLLPVNYDQVARTALYYPLGAAELPNEALEKLDLIARYVREDDRIGTVYIDGHTDGVGLSADNLALSRERAEAVAEHLIQRGVAASQITTRWHGQRYPVASNRDAEGRAQNRRVTVRLERLNERLSGR